MIKGVNKHIVEINNPQNEYFEKAILYVRTEKLAIPTKELSNEAYTYLNSLGFHKKHLPWGIIFGAVTFISGLGFLITGIVLNF